MIFEVKYLQEVRHFELDSKKRKKVSFRCVKKIIATKKFFKNLLQNIKKLSKTNA